MKRKFTERRTKEATCTEGGYIQDVYTCLVCGAETFEWVDRTESLEHDYEEIETKQATESEPGYIKYQCTGCSLSYIKRVYYFDGYCDEHGMEHDFSKSTLCSRCGESESSWKCRTEHGDHYWYKEKRDVFDGYYEDGDFLYTLVRIKCWYCKAEVCSWVENLMYPEDFEYEPCPTDKTKLGFSTEFVADLLGIHDISDLSKIVVHENEP